MSNLNQLIKEIDNEELTNHLCQEAYIEMLKTIMDLKPFGYIPEFEYTPSPEYKRDMEYLMSYNAFSVMRPEHSVIGDISA